MMQLLSKKNNQVGAYLPLMALGIVALLGVAALSIDAANMFYTNLQYKKATDAAVVAALEYRVKKGYHSTLHTDYDQNGFNASNASIVNDTLGPMQKSVIQRAREIARNNAIFSMPNFKTNLKEEDIQVKFEGPSVANNSSEALQVEFRNFQRNNLLMTTGLNNLLGGSGNKDNFKTSSLSTGDISPVQIVLMVDLSNSMMCPVSFSYYQEPTRIAACNVAMGEKQSIELGTDTVVPNVPRELGSPVPGNRTDERFHTRVIRDINRLCYCGCLITETDCPNSFAPVGDNLRTGNFIMNDAAGDPSVSGGAPTRFSQDSKMNHLIQGVDAFMERFRPEKDNITIIPFNASSFVVKPMNVPLTQDIINQWDVSRQIATSAEDEREVHNSGLLNGIFNEIVNPTNPTGGLRLGDWTNPSDALLSGYIHNLEHNSDASGNIRVKTHYVLFTDGAPSAARILLEPPGTTPNFANDTRNGVTEISTVPMDNDVTLLSILSSYVQYSANGLTAILDSGGTLWAPSTLLRSTPLNSNPSLYGLQVADTKDPAFSSFYFTGAGIPDPENASTYADFWPGGAGSNISVFDLARRPFSPPNFIQPEIVYEAQRTDDGFTLNCVSPSVGNSTITNSRTTLPAIKPVPDCTAAQEVQTIAPEWIQAFFNIPIYYADVLRENNGMVHTIGFGEADPCQPTTSGGIITYQGCQVDGSPYQNYLDAISRKDILLGRIAGRSNITINEVDEFGVSTEKELVIPNFPTTLPPDNSRQGTYSAADENFSIVRAFEQIADDIVRLSR